MLTAELSEIKAHERERLSIGLHDEVAQPLAIAKMKLRALAPSLSTFDDDRIGSIIASVDQAIQATRTLTMELNTRMLAGPGLSVALRRLGERLMAEAGVDFEFQCEILSMQADQETGLMLFRAVRELLYNVVKHSGASRAALTITAQADAVQIVVQDNGRGFASTGAKPEFGRPGAFGLRSVHDQLAQADGTTEIFNVAGQGVRVVLTVPSLQRAAHTL
jgi:signal transduction histidine kinase